jgi:hypothetical protein
MAFILKQSDTYSWPVAVEFPVDGGRFEKQTFDAEFKRLPQDRIEVIRQDVLGDTATDRSVCVEVLVGWKGITDDSGDVPFSEKARDDLLNIPLVPRAVMTAWMDSLSGAKRKN